MISRQFFIKAILEWTMIEKRLNELLRHKTVKAFGKDSESYYHEGPEESFKISKVRVDSNPFIDEYKNKITIFGSVDVFLENYNANDGIIYTDKKFLSQIDKLLKGFVELRYSEYGMQGSNYVNLDLNLTT